MKDNKYSVELLTEASAETTINKEEKRNTSSDIHVSDYHERIELSAIYPNFEFNQNRIQYISSRKHKKLDYIFISDEKFIIDQEDDLIFISHPNWSLVGQGKTLYEAEMDLLSEIKSALQHYKSKDISKLSSDAIQLREFLFSAC